MQTHPLELPAPTIEDPLEVAFSAPAGHRPRRKEVRPTRRSGRPVTLLVLVVALVVGIFALSSCELRAGNGANAGSNFPAPITIGWFVPLQGISALVAAGEVSACGAPPGPTYYQCQANWMVGNVWAGGFEAGVWNDGRGTRATSDYIWWYVNNVHGSVNIKDTLACIQIEENEVTRETFTSIIWPGNARCRFNDYF